jgi:tetratricopeptide (TPR) repeat protein
MDRHHPSLLSIAITAAVCFSICSGAATAEHVRTQSEAASPAADASSVAAIEGALARVNAARSGADADPLALEEALTALGDAYLKASRYAPAEAAYAEAVRSAEQHGGRETQRVLAALTGLGATLARTGHHHDAIPLLQRAVAITRAQFGMFDLRQQDALETLAGSLTALDRQTDAQDLMTYRVRVAEKTYGEGSPKVIPSLCDLGDWFADIGKTPEARMTFQVALNIVGTTDNLNAPIMVEPLRGIARAYMLWPSYPDYWRRYPEPELGCGRLHAVPPPECLNPARRDATGRRVIRPRALDPEGEEALKRALRILEADPGLAPVTLIETLIQMGDWHQIKKSPREALTYYERAWKLISSTPNLPESAAAALNVPVRVYYPTPQIAAHVPQVAAVDTRPESVQVEFTVAADGSVSHAHIVDHDTRERYARDILEAVRDSRFRPKFVDGQAVAATGITYREVFWTAKARD